jgi:hypothetical protein
MAAFGIIYMAYLNNYTVYIVLTLQRQPVFKSSYSKKERNWCPLKTGEQQS